MMQTLTRRARLGALTVLLLLVAARPASAAYWWLTWLDELSGPGPYHGPIFPVEILCLGTTDPKTSSTGPVHPSLCKPDRSNTLFTLQLEMGFWDDNPDPARYSGDVSLKSYQLIAYFPIHKIPGTNMNRVTRATEFGAGIGFYTLNGETIIDPDYWRGSVPLRVRLLPSELFYGNDSPTTKPRLRRVLQAIQIRAGWDFLPGTISSDSFRGLPAGETSNEFVGTAGIQFDLGSLFWAAVRNEPKGP